MNVCENSKDHLIQGWGGKDEAEPGQCWTYWSWMASGLRHCQVPK